MFPAFLPRERSGESRKVEGTQGVGLTPKRGTELTLAMNKGDEASLAVGVYPVEQDLGPIDTILKISRFCRKLYSGPNF
ncbi:MAG: hypothetical protein C7B43_07145 [Sulfobacillus benefaciens]|uniref:Uncharacterized protein n=1 Tax=Sulfobacillus benefaciens TaxID=453960 RepID=A0A2T2X6B8_9FIRM|nr:MAG: hypothetical protein C7B43_07145 [Sulfobacillus benefaciens]